MYKYFLLIFIFLVGYTSNAQDTLSFPGSIKNKKVGVYKTYQEFLKDSPSVQKPLKMLDTFEIDYEKRDTNKVFTYQFLDYSKKIRKFWGICDGNNVYVKVGGQGLVRIAFIGQYSFAIFDEVNNVELNPLTNSILISAVDAIISPQRKELYYFNEQGHFLKATNQAIGWLIRKEKDLFAEFNNEKKITMATYRKYLELMNKRYPLK